jgi:hypothetical protein
MEHPPAQHSRSVRHASPICRQYEGAAEQRPSTQYLEQQSPSASHGLPEVRQSGFNGAQTSFVQTPPQHSSPDVHASPSAVH